MSVLNIHWKDWGWSWNSNTLATWCEELTHLKRPWCWEKLKTGGEGDDRGWDGWLTSPTQWTCVWVGFGSWWWTGKSGMLQSMGSLRVRHDWVTELTDWLKCLSTDQWIRKCEIYMNIIQPQKEGNLAIFDNTDWSWEHYAEWDKTETGKYCVISLICGIWKVHSQRE